MDEDAYAVAMEELFTLRLRRERGMLTNISACVEPEIEYVEYALRIGPHGCYEEPVARGTVPMPEWRIGPSAVPPLNQRSLRRALLALQAEPPPEPDRFPPLADPEE